jgi:Arc/MetJ-type ribon-helix-helix transcriptional regulator
LWRYAKGFADFGLESYTCRNMLKTKPATEERIAAQLRRGAFESEDDVIAASLDLLEQQQGTIDRVALRAAIEEGEAARARGEFVSGEESRRRIRAVIERHRPKE